jgi:hypothetical protein
MDDITNRPSAPPGWIEALEDCKAQIAAGQTVPLEPVLGRLQASIDRMEARRAARTKTVARDG